MKSRMCYLFMAIVVVLLAGCGSSSQETKQTSASDVSTSSVASLKAAQTEFPNSGLLVSGESLQASIGAKGLVIIDTRTPEAFESSHIPGAINVRWTDYRDGSARALKSKTVLATQLGEAGISRDSSIVIYDDTIYSWGAAARIFWMLDYLGCDDIHILNGGWDKWAADAKPTQAGKTKLPVTTFTPSDNLRTDISTSKSHIMNRLGSSDFVVLDTRTDEEYMGWQLYGEARPGHITGAVNIPYASYYGEDRTVLDFKKLKALFESRGVTSDKEVVAYCTSGIRSAHAYFLMRLMGYSRCANYDGSIKEWAATTPELPMEHAANFKRVVYPGWVNTLVSGGTPATFPAGNDFRIFECGWGERSNDYAEGHIPGAFHFDTNNVEARNNLTNPANPFPVSGEDEKVWDLVSDPLLQARIAALGIGNTTTVILYGNQIATTRVYWALRYAGVDVRYLNGGMAGWTYNGYPAETTPRAPTAAAFTINPQTQFKALTPEIKAYADFYRANGTVQPGTKLVDVRTLQEYIGEVIGYNDPNITRKGRIPGALWGYDADSSSPYYIDGDSTLRSYAEVRDMWAARGIAPGPGNDTIVFYCGTGWRSTLSFLYADLMGWQNIKNYDSWYVYSTFYEAATGTVHASSFNDPAMQIDTGWPSSVTGL